MSGLNKLNKIEILKLFKENIIIFLDNLIELFPEESDIIVVRILFDTQISIEKFMKIFSSMILPAKDIIQKKDEKFFLDDPKFFDGVDQGKVIHWKRMWQSGRLEEDDKKQLWSWLDLFVNLCEQYNNVA